VGGTIGSVDGDVAMLVNVRSALRFNDVVSKRCGGVAVPRLPPWRASAGGAGKSDVPS
jgi:hypothetical protein